VDISLLKGRARVDRRQRTVDPRWRVTRQDVSVELGEVSLLLLLLGRERA
jgi:hypothetical protein